MLNRALLALLIFFSVAGTGQAVDQVTESTDAGVNADTAILVSNGRSVSVAGTLRAGTGNPFETNPVDVDVYKFTVPEDMNVVIEGKSDVCDVNLLLLDGQFQGIQADDDSGGSGYGGFNARMALLLRAGTYYVAVGQNNIGAFPANATAPGSAVWNNDSGVIAPSKASVPISFIGADDATPAPTDGEAYGLSLSYQQLFTPTVTSATTNEDDQTSSGLVITANVSDDDATTNFKITAINGGTLYLNDGTTQIVDGDFITMAEGEAGLKFTPSANTFSPSTTYGFSVQAATSAADADLQGTAVSVTVTVNAVADLPSVTDATTLPETQTTSGLVITINAVDGKEVTHFKISNILNGTVYQNDGTTVVAANSYITVADGSAGLKFTPAAGFAGDATFDIQGATDNLGAGLGDITTATITVEHPTPDIATSGAPVLNPRTGLFEQTVTVTNSSTVIMDGFRLTVVNMVPDVILWNRTHAYLPVIEDLNEMAPGASRNVVVQFYTKTRKLNSFIPQYVIENLSAGPDPLPGSVAGLYHGLIDRSTDAALSPNPEMGARFELAITAKGTVSGAITEGITRRPFTGRLSVDPSALTQPYLLVRMPRTTIDLELFFDPASGIADGVIHGAGPGALVLGWRKVWRTKTPLNLATDYRGRHNLYMENTDSDGPQGFGNMIVNVTGNDGTFSLVSYLPDGTKFTGSSFVGPQGQVRVYRSLYANKGSVLGYLQIMPGPAAPTDNEVLGFVDWMKPPQALASKDRVYKAGFDPVLVFCEGGYYEPPAPGKVLFGVPAAAVGNFNSGFDFYEGGLDTEGLEFIQETRLYSLGATSRINRAQVIAPNPNKVVISDFSSATGIFTGTFTLPAQVGVVGARTVGYRGLLVPACGCTLGYGYFLLPQVPVLPQTLNTSPKLSGRLEWLDADEFTP